MATVSRPSTTRPFARRFSSRLLGSSAGSVHQRSRKAWADTIDMITDSIRERAAARGIGRLRAPSFRPARLWLLDPDLEAFALPLGPIEGARALALEFEVELLAQQVNLLLFTRNALTPQRGEVQLEHAVVARKQPRR